MTSLLAIISMVEWAYHIFRLDLANVYLRCITSNNRINSSWTSSRGHGNNDEVVVVVVGIIIIIYF